MLMVEAPAPMALRNPDTKVSPPAPASRIIQLCTESPPPPPSPKSTTADSPLPERSMVAEAWEYPPGPPIPDALERVKAAPPAPPGTPYARESARAEPLDTVVFVIA